MELRFQFVFLLSCIFCISSIDRSVSLPSLVNLGIAPEDENYYKGLSSGAINCKDGSKKFTKAELNDDFCDCPDGSDEPGTSACPSGKFYCKNAGHAPLFIYSSRVNDGICDCCDGSDEHDGKVKCPNTCWEVGRVARDKLKKKIATFQEGITIRKKEIEEAKLAIAKEETEVSKLKNEQKILKGRVEQLQDKKEQIEKVEEEERLKREKEEKERKEADDAKLEASKVEEKTEVHEEAVKSDIHDKIGLLEDYPPLKDVVEGHDKAADEEQHGDHSVKDEFPVDEVEQAPEDSSQHPEVKEESSTNNNKADVSSRNEEKDAAENIESLSKEELGRVIGSRWLGKKSEQETVSVGDTIQGINRRRSEGKSSFRATADYDDKTLHVNQHTQTSDTAKLKKGSKIVGGGLRQYSIMVCKKVEDKGRITYSEVADEIIAELMTMENSSSVPLNESDEKNIRRRVYDSLNVLMALDVIERDRKEIRWKGLPNSDARDMEETKKGHAELLVKIGKKAAYLKDLEEQLASLQNLKLRNEQSCKSTNGPSQGFSLPFILVQTAPHATVEVEISEDMQLVHFDFNSVPFSLHDDAYVLKLMRNYELLESESVSRTS